MALIRTLALKPDILLLDEPMSALDSQSRLSISDDIYKIIKSEGKTAIMVTHDIGEVMYKKSITIFRHNKTLAFTRIFLLIIIEHYIYYFCFAIIPVGVTINYYYALYKLT